MYKNPFISSTSQLNSNIMAPPALPSSSVASVFEPSPVPNQNEQPATNFNQTEVIDQLSSSVSHETPKLGAVPLFQSSQPVPMQPYYQPMTISSIANQDPQSTSLHSNPSSTHGTVSLGGGINNALPGSNNFVGPDGISSAPPVGVNNLPPGELYNASGRNPFSRPGGINNEPPGGMNNALRGESTFIHPGGVNEAPGGNPFIRHGGVNNAPHVRVNDAPLGGSTFLQPSGIRNPTPGGNTHHVGEISGAPIANAFVRPGGATDPMILPEYNSTAPPIAQFYNPSQFGGPDIISQPQ